MSDYIATDVLKDGLCADYTGRVGKLSLHTGHPGTTGADESAVPQKSLTWTAPADGVSSATATYTGLVGVFPWAGLWDGATYLGAVEVNISNSTSRDVAVMLTHEVK